MSTIVLYTTGHISIRRGRVTRQYPNPTRASFHRLCRTCGDGPTDYLTTNRSTIYIWHGLSTLTTDQRKLYDLYHAMTKVEFTGDNGRGAVWGKGYLRGISTACQKVGIHKLLLHPDFYAYGE